MTDHREQGKRIAKNTVVLYIRMAFLMAVNIYISRVVLEALGVDDYGIYNVVGGFVSMFSILSGSISAAISRFITFEIGRAANLQKLKSVFSTSVTVQVILGLLIVFLAEVFGLWFINEKMNISPDRLVAANWVFQLSLLTFVVNLLSIPYNAIIIAYEKMSAFAFISIFEGLIKLSIAFLIIISPIDRLIFYSILMCLLALVVRFLYSCYCRRTFSEARYSLTFDKGLFKEMFAFAGWNFIGNGAYVLNNQGVNVLSNIFFGVGVNAARGVVGQVESAINQFVGNFTMAVNPQITKSYASGDLDYMYRLVCKGARFSYFMMMFFAVPVIIESDMLLQIWLKEVPDYAPVFLRYATACSLCTVLSNTLVTAMFAYGDIRKYQIIVGSVGLLVLPLSYIFFKCGFPPQIAYVVYFIIYLILLFVRLRLLQNMIGLPISLYVKTVLLKIIPVTLFAFILPFILIKILEPSILRVLLTILVSLISVAVSVWIFGLQKFERNQFAEKVKSFFTSKFKQ